jgi:hypothetical protein
MEHLFRFYYEDERVRCFGDAWEVLYDGLIRLQVEEVEEVVCMSMSEILERNRMGENFTPDSLRACEEYVRLRGEPPVDTTKPRPQPRIVS